MSTQHAPPPSQAGAAAAVGVHALPSSKRSRLEEAGFAAVVRMELKKKNERAKWFRLSFAFDLLSPLFFATLPRFFRLVSSASLNNLHSFCSSRREKKERAKTVERN